MMPLKDNLERTDENNKKEKVSGALSTEEIVSLLNKSNKDFIKESEISSTITNLFKKVTPTILAEKNKDFEPAGECYGVYWNGPFIPGFFKRSEVHLPIRKKNSSPTK